jgi:hypothetical protein
MEEPALDPALRVLDGRAVINLHEDERLKALAATARLMVELLTAAPNEAARDRWVQFEVARCQIIQLLELRQVTRLEPVLSARLAVLQAIDDMILTAIMSLVDISSMLRDLDRPRRRERRRALAWAVDQAIATGCDNSGVIRPAVHHYLQVATARERRGNATSPIARWHGANVFDDLLPLAATRRQAENRSQIADSNGRFRPMPDTVVAVTT